MVKIIERVGIEKIAVYPAGLSLNLEKLANHRGYDLQNLNNSLMVKERSVNPLWEDAVTMAVNVANRLDLAEDKNNIGLLIVGTETGVDQEKSVSSWVHHFLGLPSDCRNFEIKSACYSGTAAMNMALGWLLAQKDKTKKALVITTDQSLIGLNEPYEYILGAGASALLLSYYPEFLEIPFNQCGVYASEVTDVIRPLPWIETGNSETSLFSYMDSLQNAYDAYVDLTKNNQFDTDFDFNVYHMPFAGISFRAHTALLQRDHNFSREKCRQNFNLKTLPSLVYPQQIGGTYGGCVFIALVSLMAHAENILPGKRVGIFSYGSGSCAEYYSGIIGEKAKQIAIDAKIDQLLKSRYELTVDEYENLERMRVKQQEGCNFSPDLSFPIDCYKTNYAGKNYLILDKIKDYYRYYVWS